MAIDRNRFASFMEQAGHVASNPHEAVTAVKMAKAMLVAEGLDFTNVRFTANNPFDLPDLPKFTAAPAFSDTEKKRIDTAEKNEKLVAENKRLAARVASLEEKLENATAVRSKGLNEDGSMAYVKFEFSAVARYTQRNGWKRAFSDHMGIEENTIQSWQKTGTAPKDAVEALKTFSMKNDQDDPSGDTWTFEEDELLDTEYADVSDATTSKKLTVRFGRKITLGSVKKGRQRNRAHKLIVDTYEGGTKDAPSILAILRDNTPVGSGGRSIRFINKVLDHHFDERKRTTHWQSSASVGGPDTVIVQAAGQPQVVPA